MVSSSSDVKLQANGDARPLFQCVSFHVDEIPDDADRSDPGKLAIALATKIFDLQPKDLNPKHPGKYYGRGKYGHVFEVQVIWDVGINISVRNNPAVLNIFE